MTLHLASTAGRTHRGRRPPELGQRRPRLLRLGNQYDIISEHHALIVYRVERRNSAFSNALRPVPNSPLAAGCGCTIWLPESAKARRRTRTPRPSRPSSRTTGQARPKSSQLAPVCTLADTPDGSPLSTLSYCIWIYPPTCPALMLAGAFRYNAASPVPTPTTMATCRSACQRG